MSNNTLQAMPFGNSSLMTAMGDRKRAAIPQSQRDCVLQPRVARNELPWVNRPTSFSTPTALRHIAVLQPQPRWGCADQGGLTQGSSFLATLGFGPESLWDSEEDFPGGIDRRPRGRSKYASPRSRRREEAGFISEIGQIVRLLTSAATSLK